MMDTNISLDEWQALYQSAIEFRDIESWNWMNEGDIFAVQNPYNGELGYCCIMGELGEHFALAVYLGTKGLEGYWKLSTGEIEPEDIDAIHIQDCLMASYEDRNFLHKEDLNILKKLGLKFRGRKQWPYLRRYQPGYYPWFLNKDEVIYLTLVLQQAKIVALRFKEKPDMLLSRDENSYFTRVADKVGNNFEWKDIFTSPQPIVQDIANTEEQIDELRLERIKRNSKKSPSIWEIDIFYSPTPVCENSNQRPYYPKMIFYVAQNSLMILNSEIFRTWEKFSVSKNFLDYIEKMGILPKTILVKKEDIFHSLKPITEKLEIRITLVKELEAIKEVKSSLFQFLMR